MRKYDVLVSYLRESNFNEDGSPSNDDDYFKVVEIISDCIENVIPNVEKTIFESNNLCGIEDDYIEDSLEICEILSTVGHLVS